MNVGDIVILSTAGLTIQWMKWTPYELLPYVPGINDDVGRPSSRSLDMAIVLAIIEHQILIVNGRTMQTGWAYAPNWRVVSHESVDHRRS